MFEWDWTHDGTSATTDLGDGRTATMRVVPDEEMPDLGDTEYTEHELQNLEVSGVIVTVYQHGHEIHEGSLWGITTFSWTPWQECRDYAQEIAADIIREAPSVSDLASLMLGYVR